MASLDTQSQSLYNGVVSWLHKWSQFSSSPCICLLYKATLQLVSVRGGNNFPTPWIWDGPEICFGRMPCTGWWATSEPEAFLEPRSAHVYKPRLACRMVKDVWSSRLLPQLAACQQSDKRMRPSQNSQPWAKLPPDSQWASPAEVSPDWPRSSEPSWNTDSWAVEATYWFKPLGFVVVFMQHFCGNKKMIQMTYKVLRDPQLPLFFWLHLLLLSGSLVHHGPSHSDPLAFPGLYQLCSSLRDFVLAISSAWNALLSISLWRFILRPAWMTSQQGWYSKCFLNIMAWILTNQNSQGHRAESGSGCPLLSYESVF